MENYIIIYLICMGICLLPLLYIPPDDKPLRFIRHKPIETKRPPTTQPSVKAQGIYDED